MTWVSENIKLVAIVLLLVLGALWFKGFGGPGKVGPLTQEYAQALTQILQRRDDPRLPKTRAESLAETRDKIAVATGSGDISEPDAELLNDVIESALAGDEKSAKQDLRAIMDAQVNR
jgi:hypothetical protein